MAGLQVWRISRLCREFAEFLFGDLLKLTVSFGAVADADGVLPVKSVELVSLATGPMSCFDDLLLKLQPSLCSRYKSSKEVKDVCFQVFKCWKLLMPALAFAGDCLSVQPATVGCPRGEAGVGDRDSDVVL